MPLRTLQSILIALTLTALAVLSSTATHACTLKPELSHVVAKVTSADTITLDDGSEVVLIGALPPVNLDTATSAWPPAELSRKALERLVSGQPVGLAFAGRRRDRYGRHLAHVFLDRDGQRIWVQANLIASGHARAYALPGNTACLNHLLDHERSARTAKSGHWATGIFQDRDAHASRSLARYHGTFQTIEGRIDHIAKVNGHQVLDFSADHRQGFSVWLPPRTTTRATNATLPKELTGQHVRVRGWIEMRRSPRLTITSPAEIEHLDSNPTQQMSGVDEAPSKLPSAPTATAIPGQAAASQSP